MMVVEGMLVLRCRVGLTAALLPQTAPPIVMVDYSLTALNREANNARVENEKTLHSSEVNCEVLVPTPTALWRQHSRHPVHALFLLY